MALNLSLKKINPSIIYFLIGIIIISVIVGVVLTIFAIKPRDASFKIISSENAGDNLVSFINEVYGAQVGAATLKDVSEENGLYKMVIQITPEGAPTEQTVYVSRDGKLFFPQAVDIQSLIDQFRALQQQQQAQPQNPTITPGTDAPVQ